MIKHNVNLQHYNTFGLKVNAAYFAEFENIAELKAQLNNNTKELLVLGGGSNVLFTKNFNGLVLINKLHGIEVETETEEHVYLKAAAGETWHQFVLNAIEKNLGGIENLSLIPGSVGAAPMQNIGAYGVEVKDVFHSLEALNIKTLELETFNREQCEFGYRESVFKRKLKGKYIITSVTLKLSKKADLNTTYGAIEQELNKASIPNPTLKDVSDAVIRIRQSKLPDPQKIGNAGSFFKNPVISKQHFLELQKEFPTLANYPISETEVKLAAGWLIDNAGWKGKTFGNYGVHKNQALVLVNYGGAMGSEIYALSEKIIEEIKSIYGITLEREVNII
jgi:UDP-N-acetylmuramate dehydrogenase